MKKFFAIFLLSCTAIVQVFAQAGYKSTLKVSLTDNAPISISVDDAFLDMKGPIITVRDITPGVHNVKVFRADMPRGAKPAPIQVFTVRTNAENATTCIVDPIKHTVNIRTNTISRFEKDNDPAVDDVYEKVKDKQQDQVQINVIKEDRIVETRDLRDNTVQQDGDAADNNGRNPRDGRRMDNNNDRDDNADEDADDQNDRSAQNGRGRDRKNDAKGIRYDGRYEDNATPVPMTVKEINALKTRVQKRTADAQKEAMLEEAISDRSYNTEQVRTMLRWMKNESSRLDFAKYAYDGVSDPENFLKLNTEFKLPASKKELKVLVNTRY